MPDEVIHGVPDASGWGDTPRDRCNTARPPDSRGALLTVRWTLAASTSSVPGPRQVESAHRCEVPLAGPSKRGGRQVRLLRAWVHNLRSEFCAADWPSAVGVLVGDRCRDCGLCDPRVRICRCVVPDGHDDHDGRFPRGSPAVHGGRVVHDRADPRGCGNRAVHVRDSPRSAHRGAPTPAAREAADGAADRPDDWSFHHLRMGPRWSGQRAVSRRAR